MNMEHEETSNMPNTEKAAAKRETVASKSTVAAIPAEDRHRYIAEAAYFKAEQRHFVGGDPVRDWLEAEAEIEQTYY